MVCRCQTTKVWNKYSGYCKKKKKKGKLNSMSTLGLILSCLNNLVNQQNCNKTLSLHFFQCRDRSYVGGLLGVLWGGGGNC